MICSFKLPPELQRLNPAEHIQVSGRILLNHVGHVVRPQRLPELAPCHKVAYLTHGPDRVLVLPSQHVATHWLRQWRRVFRSESRRVQVVEEVECAMGERGLDGRDADVLLLADRRVLVAGVHSIEALALGGGHVDV